MNTPENQPVSQAAKDAAKQCYGRILRRLFDGKTIAELTEQQIAETLTQETAALQAQLDGWKASFGNKDADLQEAKKSIALLKEYHELANQDRGRLQAQLDDAKLELGRLHGKIGTLANRTIGISDNLPTDDTLNAIEACVKTSQQRMERYDAAHKLFHVDLVELLHRCQIGDATCIYTASVIEAERAKLVADLAAQSATLSEAEKDKRRLDNIATRLVTFGSADEQMGQRGFEGWELAKKEFRSHSAAIAKGGSA